MEAGGEFCQHKYNQTEHVPIWELWPGLILILLNSGLNQHSQWRDEEEKQSIVYYIYFF